MKFFRRNKNKKTDDTVHSSRENSLYGNESTRTAHTTHSKDSHLKDPSAKTASMTLNYIMSENESNHVVVWSKKNCAYCTRAKKLLESFNVEYVVHELDELPNGRAIQNQLAHLTGQKTVPNIFVNNQHIGGNDDLRDIERSGRLLFLLH